MTDLNRFGGRDRLVGDLELVRSDGGANMFDREAVLGVSSRLGLYNLIVAIHEVTSSEYFELLQEVGERRKK